MDGLFHRYVELRNELGDSFRGGLLDGLGAAEISLLEAVASGPERSLAELGELLRLRPSTLTGLADRLESRGLAERRSRPGDRRARVLAPTELGRKAAGEHREREREYFRSLLMPVGGNRKRAAFLDALRAIIDSFEAGRGGDR